MPSGRGAWMSLDVSPDGRTIVFDLMGDLFSLPIAGGRATRLTVPRQSPLTLDYSPAECYPERREIRTPACTSFSSSPEIPHNTGGSTCVAIGAELGWCGRWGDYLRRSGLDYWEDLEWEAIDGQQPAAKLTRRNLVVLHEVCDAALHDGSIRLSATCSCSAVKRTVCRRSWCNKTSTVRCEYQSARPHAV